MSSAAPSSPSPPQTLAALLTLPLLVAAGAQFALHLAFGFAPEDSHHLETPLAMAAARQLTEAPERLYDPASSGNTPVLIHAPLYYRVVGSLAAPVVAMGADPVLSCLIAGRLVSFGSAVALLVAVVLLATRPWSGRPAATASPWAGVWAALVVAGCPLIQDLPVTVRPDMAAAALQTWGFLFAVRAFDDAARQGRRLIVAYVLFALAACCKQHDVALAAATSLGLAFAWSQGRIPAAPILWAHAAGLALLAGYYACEHAATEGAMTYAVFQLAAELRSLRLGGWSQVQAVFAECAKHAWGWMAAGAACLVLRPRRAAGSWLDAWLVAGILMEVALMIFLCHASTGAWTNYALQAVVLGGIWLGRMLDRAVLSAGPLRFAVAAAAGLALCVAARHGWQKMGWELYWREWDRQAWAALGQDPQLPRLGPDQTYVGLEPHYNRLYGRIDLAHDEWLYDAFEKMEAAPPRSDWLKAALTAEGPIRRVVVPSEAPGVPGVDVPLDRLGYLLVAQHGRFRVWDRR